MKSYSSMTVAAVVLVLGACGRGDENGPAETMAAPAGDFLAVEARTVPAVLEVSGTAEPFEESTLSTKLMGTVTAVRVREGDRVRRGEVLLELDARDLDAKAAQVEASLAEANAVLREATAHLERMRMLFAEEAAPKAQLDAAEASSARAQAAVQTANAAAAELRAVREYATVRAPFDGVVVRRLVDPGAFASPGAPLLVVQDSRRLRIVAVATPDAARALRRGDAVRASIEGVPVDAVVEGVVPAAGSLYTINALVDNASGAWLPGSAATLSLVVGSRTAVFVPVAAVHREGDLTGLWIGDGSATALRWVRLGRAAGDSVEVLAGLRGGDRILVPVAVAGAD
jgi:RND family efflux transporter MFP subunit